MGEEGSVYRPKAAAKSQRMTGPEKRAFWFAGAVVLMLTAGITWALSMPVDPSVSYLDPGSVAVFVEDDDMNLDDKNQLSGAMRGDIARVVKDDGPVEPPRSRMVEVEVVDGKYAGSVYRVARGKLRPTQK